MKRLLALAILMLVPPAFGTITQVQSQHNWSGSGTTCVVNFTSGPTLGNMIAVWTSWTTSGANNVTATVKDSIGNGVGAPPMFPSAVGPTVQSAASSPTAAQIFYAKNITGGGSDTVTVTFSSAPSSSNCVIVEYSGLDQNYPLDSVSAGYSTSGNPTSLMDSGTVAPANANLLVFGGGTSDTGTANLQSGGMFTVVQKSGGSLTEQMVVAGNNALQRATVCLNTVDRWHTFSG